MFNQTPSAPLDAGELALALKPFGTSRMLPKAAYVDPEVLAWERRNIFSEWMCVGRASDLPEKRMAKAYSVGGSSVLVLRGEDGELRAFENACRHRGHELLPCGAEAAENQRVLMCPYHAWTYNLDGSLKGAPGFKKHGDFEQVDWSLNQIPLRDWHGWIFVDPSRHAPDFTAHIGELEGILSNYDAETLVTAETHEYDVAANWKVVIENYQECYHCSMIHPELCRISAPESGENLEKDGNWVGGWMDLRTGMETMSLDGRSNGSVMSRLDDEESHTVMYVAVMPNLLISLHPDYVMTHLLIPVTPDLTRIQCSWAFPPHVVEAEGFDPAYAVDFWDLTNKQDWSACESVQRGIKAPNFVPGPLAPEEDGVYHFVTLLAKKYLGEVDDRVNA